MTNGCWNCDHLKDVGDRLGYHFICELDDRVIKEEQMECSCRDWK